MPDKNILKLRQAEAFARSPRESNLEFLAGQLVRVPAALGIIFCTAVFTTLFVWVVWH
jgi:hypothetical protein